MILLIVFVTAYPPISINASQITKVGPLVLWGLMQLSSEWIINRQQG